MRKVIISVILCVISMGIHANDAFHLNDEQLQNVKEYVCVAITKNAMSSAQSPNDQMSYNNVFKIIGDDSIVNSGFKDFKVKIEGPEGGNWKKTKSDIWEQICLLTDRSNRLEDILSGLDDDRYKNCRPEDVKRQVNKYRDSLKNHKPKQPSGSKDSISEHEKDAPKSIKSPNAYTPEHKNTGFSMFQMILACLVSFVCGIVVCILGNLTDKVEHKRNRRHRHHSNHSHNSHKESNKNAENKSTGDNQQSVETNKKQSKNDGPRKEESSKIKESANTEIKKDSCENYYTNETKLDKNEKLSNQDSSKISNPDVKTIDIDEEPGIEPDIVDKEPNPVEEEKVTYKYLRKLSGDTFAKSSPSMDEDCYYAINEKTMDLTAVEENSERALYYRDDILTTFVVEIESEVSNPRRIKTLSAGKVEKVSGGWKVVKKVKIKLI